MSNTLPIYAGTVKELFVIVVTVNGAVVTTGYQVILKPTTTEPLSTDPNWQTPDTAGTDTGIFVGSGTPNNQLTTGTLYSAWYWLTTPGPENIIKKADGNIYAY